MRKKTIAAGMPSTFVSIIISILVMALPLIGTAQNTTFTFPFQNPALSFETRVDDLVSRLTLEEKVAQMLNAAPAIDRLGVPAYNWWNETLHGVARTPYHVTVYPQAIAMAATWDTVSLRTMGDYSATEGRAIYNRSVREHTAARQYAGLTYWTPNINIFRDPRWGRGQETYGEDPFLTAMMARAFVDGLQGDDPVYLKAAACAKHYAVHSGPEPSRHVFDVAPSDYDLWNTYLPAFKELVVNAKVAGVMCAYNAFKGQPCCGSDTLMTNILRSQWQFKGYVTSDCGAIDDFYEQHKMQPDAEHASTDAVLHGTDIDCGNTAYKALVNAVKTSLLTEKQIDVSLKRLFLIRFRLGMFDPPSMVKYARIPYSVMESPEHKGLALTMARQSIVLLKNNNNTLPLKKSIKKIAVIGPNADNAATALGNYNGTPSTIVTALQGIKDKLGKGVEVVYEQAINFTNDTIFQYTDVDNQFSFEGQQGFKAEYFTNTDVSGSPAFTRIEKSLDNHWAEGDTITRTVKAHNFSARYTTTFAAAKTGDITFELNAGDGNRLYINGLLKINNWNDDAAPLQTCTVKTEKGKTYQLVVEYLPSEGSGFVSLKAGNFAKADFKAIAARVKDADAIVYIGGISPQLEGEEMPVSYPGFKGGDRTSIMLPDVQTGLLKVLQSTGRPLVFVLMGGSAVAIPWEAKNIPAIIDAWYGGQSAGIAIADVLFGDYNPAGRLPVTFYKSDEDLPAFDDYSMANRTYRYFKGQPLFPFGFGLSYTKFTYDQLQIPATIPAGKPVAVSAGITNSGQMDGDEVVELYVSFPGAAREAPVRALKGFKRIFLKKGESKTATFVVTPDDLSIAADNGQLQEITGQATISIGGGQPGTGVNNTISKTVSIQK